MRAWLWGAVLWCSLAGCGEPSEAVPLSRMGPVSGAIHLAPGLSGDAWVFLYRMNQGPPESVAIPQAITAVSAQRLDASGHFVFAQVKPNPYRLWGVLDVDGNFDANVDVLSQATKGDHVASRAVVINVQPGRGATADLEFDAAVKGDPPSFVIDTSATDLSLDATPGSNSTLTLIADPLGRFDVRRGGFELALVDSNGDGVPDDSNNDGTPDLSLSVFLRWLPSPGQSSAGEVLVPVLYNPAPFLTVLQNRLDNRVIADRLQGVVLGAQELVTDAAGHQTVTTLTSPPPGRYELVVVASQGQFWRIPNQLGPTMASQDIQLHFDRR